MATVVWLLSSFSGTTARAQQPRPITEADFVVAGVTDTTDSAAVRARLGAPDSITTSTHPFDVDAKLIDWWYRDVGVSYSGGRTPSSFWLFGPSQQTARGLRVGDSAAQVRRLYGRPPIVNHDESAWVYPLHSEELQHLKIWFLHGRVQRVFVGTALD